jgi:transglutaminase-like putative cysteine protease
VTVTPRSGVRSYRDYLGNVVHHFDVPSAHRQLTIVAETMVDVWERLDADIAARDFREMLVRRLGIPCRYVSGYLFHRKEARTRSSEGATHAWVEAYLPESASTPPTTWWPAKATCAPPLAGTTPTFLPHAVSSRAGRPAS